LGLIKVLLMSLDLISAIRERKSRNKLIKDTVIIACAASYILLASAALLLFHIPSLVAFLICSFVVIAWQIRARRFFKGSTDEEACEFIDNHYNLKNRASSLLELKRVKEDRLEESDSLEPKIRLLQSQLDKHITDCKPDEILPLKFSTALRFFSLSLPVIWILIGFVLWNFDYRSWQNPGARAASKIEKLLAEQPALPEDLKDELQKLSQLLKEKDIGSDEIEQALQNAENSLKNSQERLAESQAQKAKEIIPEEIPEETDPEEEHDEELPEEDEPPHDETPDEKPDDKEEQKQQEQEQDQEDQQQQEQKKEDQKEAEPDSGGVPDDQDDGRQQGEEAPDEDTGESSEGAEPEEGDEEGDEEGEGSGAGQGDSGDEEGTAPGEGEGESQGQGGSGEEQASDPDGSGEGESGAQEEGDPQDSSQASEDGQQEGALADTEQVLSEIRKEMEENQSEKASSEEAENGEDPQQGDEEGTEQESQGLDSEGEEQSEGAEGKEDDDSFEHVQNEDDKAASEDSDSSGASLSPSEGVKDFDEMEHGGDEPVEDFPGDFEETYIEGGDETFDSRFGSEAGRVLSEEEVESRISIDDVNLARPESLREQEEQAIPPEYRGILR